MTRSIRWSLLAWYGAILFAVVSEFAAFAAWQHRSGAIEAFDSELEGHARAIVGATEVDDEDGLEIFLSPEYMESFGEDHYFILWRANGRILAKSKGAPDVAPPTAEGVIEVDRVRRASVRGPERSWVTVAGDATKVYRESTQFTASVATAGGLVLLLALLIGWFLAGIVLKPIEKITRTAAAISRTNLSARIDLGRTESELGRLARTLNETFARLEAAFERQARFTADASHELRTPLSVVTSNAELALRKDRTPAEYREALEICLRAARRMRGVVDGLLTLARSDARELPLKREPVEMDRLVEETAALLKPLADCRNVTLSVSADPVGLTGDADRLREMVTNLAANAIEYNREGGRVDVSLRRRNGEALLRVSDSGIGIPQADQARVFERFYRVDKARSRELGGTGLGLSITKWIVEAHGGRIELASKEGEGTTFTVTLPAENVSPQSGVAIPDARG